MRNRSIEWWQSLDRGWQSICLSLLIAACATIGLRIPW